MLATLHPFSEAVAAHGARVPALEDLSSAEIGALNAQIRRTSLRSAHTVIGDLMDGYKEKIASLINPTTEQRADRVTEDNPLGNVTTGIDPATGRAEIKDLMRSMGLKPSGESGNLRDITSDTRINLVLKTNVELAQGAGRFIQMNDAGVLDEFPAQELYRLEDRAKQRDWEERWQAAASESGDDDAARVLEESGRMVALKASPIWDSLGDGAGGYDDTLGNPYPPFAFNSGMWVQSVSRDDATELGLITAGQVVEAHPLDLENLFATE